MVAQHRAHAADFFFDLFRCAVAFAEQNRLGIQIVTGVHKVFDRSGHGFVHHLQPGRDDAGGNYSSHCITCLAQVIKAGHDAARQHRFGHQFDSHLQRHGEHAFAADDHRQQVIARVVQRVAAKLHQLAFNREAFDLEHVVQRQTVFEAMHAARVFGHIAAYGAGNLAGGIGCVIQAQRRGGLADGQVAYAALNNRSATGRIHPQNFVELGQRQRDTQFVRHGTAGQAGAGTACHHWNLQSVAGFQQGLNLLIGFGQGHHQGPLAVSSQAVALIGGGVLVVPEQRVGGQYRLQRADDLRLALRALKQGLMLG